MGRGSSGDGVYLMTRWDGGYGGDSSAGGRVLCQAVIQVWRWSSGDGVGKQGKSCTEQLYRSGDVVVVVVGW